MRISVPIGTRPEVIKLAGVVAALRRAGHEVRCIATGQHTDPRMAGEMFATLNCRPDATWTLPADEAGRVGALLAASFAEIAEHRPDAVLVLGDTYTAPLMAMAARRFRVGVVHVEGGLRSFNDESVEECNRRMLASLATVHLAPTELAARFLEQEGVDPARIRVVGNPVIDALAASGVPHVPVSARRGVLVTAHRATNVDNPERLRELVRLVGALAAQHGPVTFPLHPRTRQRLEAAGEIGRLGATTGLRLVDPLPYRDLLRALAASRIVVTDSGGLQEEASYFGVPVVVMRQTTPRWEGVLTGAAQLCGLDAARVLEAVQRLASPEESARIADLPCPYGDGRTAERIVTVLDDPAIRRLLTPAEPARDLPAPLAGLVA